MGKQRVVNVVSYHTRILYHNGKEIKITERLPAFIACSGHALKAYQKHSAWLKCKEQRKRERQLIKRALA